MIYQKQENFFETPNELNSYIAGFIAADGNISKKENKLSLTLSNKDREYLQKLVSFFCSNYKVRGKNKAIVSLSCKKWKEDLNKNFNITPQKTFTLKFPEELNEKNKKAFICGYIDGDGSINESKNGKFQMNILGNESFINSVSLYLKKCGVNNNVYPVKNSWMYIQSGKQAIKILDFLYEKKLPLMDRKWNLYLERKNTKFGQYKSWTQEEEEILIENHSKMSIPSIHKNWFPDRTFDSVEKKCHYLGLIKKFSLKWLKEEDELLKELKNQKIKTKEIYEKYFPYRTFSSVKNRRRIL